MDISCSSLGYFIGYFILNPRIFHSHPWDISLQFSYEYLGYFNGYFNLIPGIFLLGTVFRVQCALPNKEMGTFPNEK
jgi:hypothetical protein